jgi:hypothetical protein
MAGDVGLGLTTFSQGMIVCKIHFQAEQDIVVVLCFFNIGESRVV